MTAKASVKIHSTGTSEKGDTGCGEKGKKVTMTSDHTKSWMDSINHTSWLA